MPRFFFDLTNGHRIPDHAGLDCKDEVSAKQAADSIAAEIARETVETPRHRLTVRTEEGDDIYQVPIPKQQKEED
jgi:hypothetical protein